MDFSIGTVLVPTPDGKLVTENQKIIGQVIRDYDDTLSLIYIPEDQRVAPNLPFAVVCHPRNGEPPYYVLYAETCDQRIVERVFTHDNTRTNVLNDIDIKNAAAQAIQDRKWIERNEELADLGAHMMNTPKHWYRYTNPTTGQKQTLRN